MIDVYYGKPPKLLSLPNCIEMSHATFRLYDCLWGLSDRYSSFQVEVTDDEIIKRTTLSNGALNIARKDLSRRGLIICNRQQRGHRYLILNPETLQPYSANPKQRIRYTKKSASPAAAQDATPPEDTLPADETPTAPPVVSEVTIAPAVSPDATGDLPETMGDAQQPTPHPIPQNAVHTLPPRPHGERDYGFNFQEGLRR
jgi:hypothetical protein